MNSHLFHCEHFLNCSRVKYARNFHTERTFTPYTSIFLVLFILLFSNHTFIKTFMVDLWTKNKYREFSEYMGASFHHFIVWNIWNYDKNKNRGNTMESTSLNYNTESGFIGPDAIPELDCLKYSFIIKGSYNTFLPLGSITILIRTLRILFLLSLS